MSQKITKAQMSALSGSYELDLIAIYNMMKEEAYKLLDKAVTEGWSTDQYLSELDKMFSGGDNV